MDTDGRRQGVKTSNSLLNAEVLLLPGLQLAADQTSTAVSDRLTGVDWRQKIENQRGAVLATELKNNANKLAKWTAAALVAGVDLIKLGYVARAHPRDPHHHVILSTQVCCSHDQGPSTGRTCAVQAAGGAQSGHVLATVWRRRVTCTYVQSRPLQLPRHCSHVALITNHGGSS